MKYFIDTEFIEGFHKPLLGKKRHFIDLISIGIVAEDGREYYAVSREWNIKDADDWVVKNVISNLPEKYFNGSNIHEAKLWKSNKQIAKDIIHFTNPKLFLHNVAEPNLEFYGYYADYDWVLFCSLFGRMIDLPKGFPMYCRDLKQMYDDKSNTLSYEQLSKMAYPSVTHNVYQYFKQVNHDKIPLLKNAVNYPKQTNEHNALADAKWNFELYKFLTK